MLRSALAWNTQRSSMASEVIRRLLNCDNDHTQEELNNIIKGFIPKLNNSDYADQQIDDIITSGIKGYSNKMKNCKENELPRHRSAEQSFKASNQKHLTVTKTWFKLGKTKINQEKNKQKSRRPMAVTGPPPQFVPQCSFLEPLMTPY